MPVQRKIEGFLRAMRRLLGLPTQSWTNSSHSLFTVEGGQRPPPRLLDRGVHGGGLRSDLMALGAIRAARQRGLAVPGDVSVVGFDDSPLIAFTDPPLTTVRQPVPAMASAAVALLVARSGRTPAPRAGVTCSRRSWCPGLHRRRPGRARRCEARRTAADRSDAQARRTFAQTGVTVPAMHRRPRTRLLR